MAFLFIRLFLAWSVASHGSSVPTIPTIPARNLHLRSNRSRSSSRVVRLLSADQSETPLTQENCTGCPVLLLCPFLFQFLRKSGMCTPFCLHHHRVGQKFQLRRHSFHGSRKMAGRIQFAH